MPAFDRADLSDRDRLVSFVREVRELLDQLVEAGTDASGTLVFDDDLRELMIGAWRDVRPEFDRLIERASTVSTERLSSHGLTGRQLRFKLRVVGRWWDRFLDAGGRRTLQWLIQMIDNVLDSLIDAVGVGGAVKEFKDALLGSVEV